MDQKTERDFYEILKSSGRTTDMLEELVRDKLHVHVIKQEKSLDGYAMHESAENEGFYSITRESYLYSVKHDLITSHNYVIIYPNLLPASLRDEIYLKGRGIGEVIRMYELQSERSIIQYGFRDSNHLWDNILRQDVNLCFSIGGFTSVPFKEYIIQFPGFGRYGIKILEYFNPKVLELSTKDVLFR